MYLLNATFDDQTIACEQCHILTYVYYSNYNPICNNCNNYIMFTRIIL